jgi:uncharacterized membrane protein YedE/YeeE
MIEALRSRENLISLAVGFVFGIGLAISGMTQPGKVIGFLDFTGNWDPSLIFVMGGGTGVYMLLYRLILSNEQPRFTSTFQLPTSQVIDRPLIVGAVIFGLGWGLGGFCPGPGLTSIFSGNVNPILFVIGMSAGILAAPKVEGLLIPRQVEPQG